MGRVKRITKNDLMAGSSRAKKFVDIQDDDDFPAFDEDEDDPFAVLDSSKPGQSRGPAPAQKKVTNIDDNQQWGFTEKPAQNANRVRGKKGQQRP